MLTNKDRELILAEFEKNMRNARRAKGELLPEDNSLLREEYPGPGLHVHDEDNPFGVHRHHAGDELDGAHVHTPQNPGGEHVHGEHAGMALIDGKHHHDHGETGWHHHHGEDDMDKGKIIPISPPGELNPDTTNEVKPE